MPRLAGGSASASVNGAKSGLRCSSSNPNGTIFPLNTVTLSRMPPLEYDDPPVCVAVPACGLLRHMLISFLIKSRLQIPFHIPTRHHTLSRTTKTTIENFHSLHGSKVSKFHGMRLYARLFKTLEKQRFPPYSILSYSRAFYLRREKQINKSSSGSFFPKKWFLALRKFFWCTIPFVEYDDL